jgi:hypothetical protein
MRHQAPQQLLAVDPVSLRPPRTLLHRNARRVEHIIGNPRRRQQAVQPKAVVTRLIAAHDRALVAEFPRRPISHPLDQSQ